MFCILLNILAACAIVTQIHSFYPTLCTRTAVRLCREIRGNPMREIERNSGSSQSRLYMKNSPFVVQKNTTTTNTTTNTTTSRRVYLTYDTVLWENGELLWDFPNEKNNTDNSTTTTSTTSPSGPLDPSNTSDILRILGITPSIKNSTTIEYV